MRERVSSVTGPVGLIEYYPAWVGELVECADLYRIEPVKAERLREALATKMAEVLGEETSSYLTFRRWYQGSMSVQGKRTADDEVLEKWRVFAIIGIAGTADILPEAE